MPKTIYKCYVTIKVNCNGTIQHISCSISVIVESYSEAKRIIKENTTFEVEEPIELIY